MHEPAWITAREAAELLGVHISMIPKLIRRGDLKRRQERPILERAEVEQLRVRREAEVLIRAARHEPRRHYPPDAEHEWLGPRDAAAVLGITKEALGTRARRGKVPSEVHDGRRWFRRDHLELVRRAANAHRFRS